MDPSDQAHDKFKQWFVANGGRYKKIQFPWRFGKIGYIGIKASTQINANQIFLAVPKKLIIGPSVVKNSKLSQILHLYDLSKNDKEQYQFNILVLFIIWNKILGEKSFYYPYLQAIGKSCTIREWNDSDIQSINDPYINVSFINDLKEQQSQQYQQFYTISKNHPQLFHQPISLQVFKQSYETVVTRSFGWGLPQTMMVPFADFLNHDSNGVYHYVLNCELQRNQKINQHSHQYIRKNGDLDLSLLGIDNLHNNEEQNFQNKRDLLIKKHKKDKKYNFYEMKQTLRLIQQQNLTKGYDVELLPSSDSQDNDSSQSQDEQAIDQVKKHAREMVRLAKKQKQQKFQQHKPGVNRQFCKDVTFNWWWNSQQQSYFIVAAHRHIAKDQQVFNSYGRRSNRFLLIWYGFTHQNNKYDSLSFRIWNYHIFKNTGNLIFARYITLKDHQQGIKIGNQRYGVESLSDQFRLKKSSLSYELMAFLRLRLLIKKQFQKPKFKSIYNDAYRTQSIEFEQMMLKQYLLVLKHVRRVYQLDSQKQDCDKAQVNYFKKILFKSYCQILQNQFKGVKILQNLLQKLEYKASLLQAYYSQLYQNEIEGSQQIRKKNKTQNRRLTLDYFKMLSKSKYQ